MSKKIYIGGNIVAGIEGKSAYQSWLDQGNYGSEAKFIESLHGADGLQGNSGYTGAVGELEVVNNLTDGGAIAALSAEMGKTLNEEIGHTTGERITSYAQFPLRLLVPTSFATLCYGADPVRIRSIMYVPKGTKGTISSTDANGVGVALYDTASHATNFATTGKLESYVGSGTASCTFETGQSGWLLMSLSNGTTVITSEREQELLESLTIDIVLPNLHADEAVKLTKDAFIHPIKDLGRYMGTGFISNTSKSWNAQGTHYMMPASTLRGKRLYLKSSDSSVTRYAFLTSSNAVATTRPDFCTGCDLVTVASGGNYDLQIIPEDCNYIYIYATYNTSTFFPDSVAIVDSVFNDTLNAIDRKTQEISDTNTELYSLIDGLEGAVSYGSKDVTLIPSAEETYNAYYQKSKTIHFSSPSVNSTALKRLLYYPEVILSGGNTLTFTTTGLDTINIFELTFKKLGTSPMLTFAPTEVLRKTQFKSTLGPGTYSFTLLEDTKRVAFVMGAARNQLISPAEVTDLITSVTLPARDVSKASSKGGSSSGSLSDSETLKQARFVHSAPTIQSLGLLHYSDIHGDDTAAGKIIEIYSKNRSLIDAVVSTGDVMNYYASTINWWQSCDLPEVSLFVLGNHDGAIDSNERGHKEGSADWDYMGKEWDFDNYFADYIEDLGVVMPEGYDDSSSPYYKSCFWHKDFVDSKIRLIGLDCIHYKDNVRYFTNEQEQWLQETLAETLDSNSDVYDYSVVFLCHYPLDDWSGDNETWDETSHKFVYNRNTTGGRIMDFKTGAHTNFHLDNSNSLTLDKRFSMRERIPTEGVDLNYLKGSTNPIGDIIQTWVNNGGKYVAWLCGHCHYDMFYYPTKYPNLLCVVIDQAGNTRGTNHAERTMNMEARTCANFYSIDTQNGLFKIVRFGLSMDRFMQKINVLCYDYINKKVINE